MNMKEALAAAIKAAAVKAIAAGTIKEGDLPEVLLEVPPQKEFGDFATNFAMQSALKMQSAFSGSGCDRQSGLPLCCKG